MPVQQWPPILCLNFLYRTARLHEGATFPPWMACVKGAELIDLEETRMRRHGPSWVISPLIPFQNSSLLTTHPLQQSPLFTTNPLHHSSLFTTHPLHHSSLFTTHPSSPFMQIFISKEWKNGDWFRQSHQSFSVGLTDRLTTVASVGLTGKLTNVASAGLSGWLTTISKLSEHSPPQRCCLVPAEERYWATVQWQGITANGGRSLLVSSDLLLALGSEEGLVFLLAE